MALHVYLFDTVIAIKLYNYIQITPQSEDMLSTALSCVNIRKDFCFKRTARTEILIQHVFETDM